MASWDFTRVKSRVFDMLNASEAGTFGATLSPRNKTRASAAIEAACYEAGLKILQTIGSFPNEFRSALISSVTVAHAALLPDHLGDAAFVEIQAYDGALWRLADWRDKNKIESYRANENEMYSALAHDEQGFPYARLYDIWENKFYFTGHAARVGLAQAQRSDVLTKVPDFFESTGIKLGLSGSLKAGEGAVLLSIADRYERIAQMDLDEFKAGKRRFAEVSEPDVLLPKHE